MERRNVVQNREDYGAHSSEGQKETYGGYEETTPWAVGNALMNYRAERRALQQEKHERGACDCEQEDEPGIGHGVLEHFKSRQAGMRQQIPPSGRNDNS